MSQKRMPIGVALNGSRYQASRSGLRIMSDSLIAFQPAIELPSNIRPSVSESSSITPAHIDKCCHFPLGSVNLRSTHSISPSLMLLRILPASFAMMSPRMKSRRIHFKAGAGRPARDSRCEQFTWSPSLRAKGAIRNPAPAGLLRRYAPRNDEGGLEGPAPGRDQHPQKHRDRPRHTDLAVEPEADGGAADPDRGGDVGLGLVAQRPHRPAQLRRRHRFEQGVVHDAGFYPFSSSRRRPGSRANQVTAPP